MEDGTFPQNLALIRLMVSETMRFTDAGRTMGDGHPRHGNITLLTQSSRAKKNLLPYRPGQLTTKNLKENLRNRFKDK